MAYNVLEIWNDRDFMQFESGVIVYEGNTNDEHFSTDFVTALNSVKTYMTDNSLDVVHWETNRHGQSFRHETSSTGEVTQYSDVSASAFLNLSAYSQEYWTNLSATFVDEDLQPEDFEHGGH